MNTVDRIILELVTSKDKPVKVSNIQDVLSNIRGAKFISVVTVTDPRLKKTGNPYTNVVKVSSFTGQINFDYENAVNNQRKREGISAQFEAQSSYAVPCFRDDGTMLPFAQHKTNSKKYLRIRPLQTSDVKYVDQNTGEEISKDKLKPWLPAKSKSSSQETEKEVVFRLFDLDSVRSIGVDGKNFVIA